MIPTGKEREREEGSEKEIKRELQEESLFFNGCRLHFKQD